MAADWWARRSLVGGAWDLYATSPGSAISHFQQDYSLARPLSIFDANGSAVIVHLNPDRGETGVTGASGSARIACGVIQLVLDE